jgi:GMP synthase (glutamine-hydrolysing)
VSAPTVLVVEHATDCPPALLGEWLTARGCTLDVCRPHAGDDLPDLGDYDALLVLGGPMGARDDEQAPWLPCVRERVREAVRDDVPTLGVCLGHQLIAVALGGTVTRNPAGQQLGLLDLGWTPAARDDELLGSLATPRRGVQWNDDVVAVLPEGATLLAATPAGEVQAVRFAPHAWGVPLHHEVDLAVLRPWADSDRGSHEALGIDQDALLRAVDEARAELDAAWAPLATSFAALAAGHAGTVAAGSRAGR